MVALAMSFIAIACSPRGNGGNGPPAEEAPDIPAMSMPDEDFQRCWEVVELRPACPERIPRLRLARDGGLDRSRAFPSNGTSHTFSAELGFPGGTITTSDAPPRFLHLNVHAGDLSRALHYLTAPETFEPGDPIQGRRREALSLGDRTWNGRTGTLVLAPSYPFGGVDGDHLVFSWRDGEREYAVSLHAWKPLDDAVAGLRVMVEATPGSH